MPATTETSCKRCSDRGYRVLKLKGRAATARRCDCQEACGRCRGTGYLLVPAGSSSVAQPCSCRYLDERIALFNATGLPAMIARATFESYKPHQDDQIKAKAKAEEFAKKYRADRQAYGLLFYGPPGTGKTHLLAAIARYLTLEKGVPCRYAELMLLLSDIRSGIAAQTRGYLDILRPLTNAPVLVIDELGKERGTDWERSMLDELISRRYNAGLTTLFATNYFLTEKQIPEGDGGIVKTRSAEFAKAAESMTLRARVGDRIYSRLTEMCELLAVNGKDFRAEVPSGLDTWD
jgi:DNA replication protein DnaC